MIVEPLGETDDPLRLPLWVDAIDGVRTPSIYENTFWFIEPTGEYILFLAGNFEKAENGYLAFASATTEVRVEVTFEEDTISVHKIDDWRHQAWAEKNMQYGTELSNLSVGDVLAQLPEEGNPDGLVNVMPLNEKYQLVSLLGMARLEFVKPFQKRRELRMVFQALHQAENQPERLLTVLIRCSDPDQNMGDLNDVFVDMIEKFENLPYTLLEGATRM